MNGKTLVALKKYQKAHGISATGLLDKSTQLALITDMIEG
jgi:murein L,D-transpeptidase YcbB/YkuD